MNGVAFGTGLSKRPKSDLGTQSSSPKAGESTTAPNSKVDSLVTEVPEDEVTPGDL